MSIASRRGREPRSRHPPYRIAAARRLRQAEQETNAAAKPVELARYLPEDTQLVQTVDVTRRARSSTSPRTRTRCPRATRPSRERRARRPRCSRSRRGPIRTWPRVFASEFNGRGASPLDGTLIRAAAGERGCQHRLDRRAPRRHRTQAGAGGLLPRKGKTYEAGQDTPEAASRFVADAGSGRFVFAREVEDAQEILRRIRNDASPGEAAEALEPAAGSVRLAMTNEDKRSCVTAFSAAMEATGEGAALALIISGDKPDPDRFDPKALKGIATGTPTVLVDALIVPIRVKKPLRDGLDALEQVVSTSKSAKSRVASSLSGLRLVSPALQVIRLPVGSRPCPKTGSRSTSPDGVADVRMVRARQAQRARLADVPRARRGDRRARASETDVRCVVLSGDGPSFCSGLDFPSFMAGDVGVDEMISDVPARSRTSLSASRTTGTPPMPVIAAIHGNCLGGGAQIALGADIRISARELKLCVMEIKYGLIPDMGITQAAARAGRARRRQGDRLHGPHDRRGRGARSRPGDPRSPKTRWPRPRSSRPRSPRSRRTRSARASACSTRLHRPERGCAEARGRAPARADRQPEPDRRGHRGDDEGAREVRRSLMKGR